MNLGSLFSGGKDSMYAIHVAQKQGHVVSCLLSVFPRSQESHMLHHPNIKWTELQSQSMKIPQLVACSDSDNTDYEMTVMENLVRRAKEQFCIEGLIHGGIKSRFQRYWFEVLCSRLDLATVSPLWDAEPERYMRDLLDSGFNFLVTSVSSDGLDDAWLGRHISEPDIDTLGRLSEKFGFNLNFEGGEAETFVTDCPLFSHPIKIIRNRKEWDGYRGRFEIVDAELEYDA